MTRNDEVERLATRAYNAAVEIINEAPDLGIALAAMAKMQHWIEAETDSRLLSNSKTLANTVMGGEQ